MKFIKYNIDGKIKVCLGETDPEKVMDIMLDEYSKADTEGKKMVLESMMNQHLKTPFTFIPSGQVGVDYDPNIHDKK